MLRSFCLALLGLGLLATSATAQTTPTKAKTAAARPSTKAAVTRRTNRLNDAAESDKGQSGYAAPGEPITSPSHNGKNTPPYDGPAAAAPKGTTLAAPK
ncbi:hypothetical protein [Hymenobacter bucti]|uniref:Serine protease n=1 Tax=Hymenobacter bucti TaxID=1844114 RepID=A0ABW4QWQ6_9BACT